MSYQMIKTVKEAIASDKELTPVDKLILLEFAWRTPEHGAPQVVRFKTYATALGLSRNGVRKRMRVLTDRGYFEETAVVVSCGAKLLQGVTQSPPKPKSGGVTQLPRRGYSVTPKGVTQGPPLKEKEKKKEPTALNLDDLGRYAVSCLWAGNPVTCSDGSKLQPNDPRYKELQCQLQKERA